MVRSNELVLRVLAGMILAVAAYFLATSLGFFQLYAQNAMVGTSDAGFMGEIFALVKAWGGLSSAVKISSVITLIISSIKVSFFKPYWDKLKFKVNGQEYNVQVLFVPLLSIVIGVVGQGKISFNAMTAYIVMGAGAVYLHEILDVIKSLPIVSPIFQVVVSVIGFIFGKPKN